MEAGLGGFPLPSLGTASKSMQTLALSSACSMPRASTSPPPSGAAPSPTSPLPSLRGHTEPLGLHRHQ